MFVSLAIKYIVFSVALFTIYTVARQFIERRFFLTLPQSLKDKQGNINFSRRIMRRASAGHRRLIKSADAKKFNRRSMKSLFQHPEIRDYIEKYVHLYQDDFSDEIFYEKFEMRTENTRLFFQLLNHKYRVSHRNLLKAILYVIEEEHYFNFRESIALANPKNYRDLIIQCVKYMIMNGKTDLSSFYVKRAAYSFGMTVSLVSVPTLLVRAKRELELRQFDKDFSKSRERVTEGLGQRVKTASTEEFMELAAKQGLDVNEGSYNILPGDYQPESKVDRVYTNHLKYALIQHFESQCVCCSAQKSLLLVHFWRPKAKGGNFAMKSKQGKYVNNCIPVCNQCLTVMGDQSPHQFFVRPKLEKLLERSWLFNTFLNKRLRELDTEEFNPQSVFRKAA